jgi:hypothetical protein
MLFYNNVAQTRHNCGVKDFGSILGSRSSSVRHAPDSAAGPDRHANHNAKKLPLGRDL